MLKNARNIIARHRILTSLGRSTAIPSKACLQTAHSPKALLISLSRPLNNATLISTQVNSCRYASTIASDDIFAPSESASTLNPTSDLALTDPLQIYQAKVARGELFPDEAQHRAAVELQKLSERLVDYKPPTNFRYKVRQLSQLLEEHEERQQREAEQHPEVVQRAWYLPDEKSNQLIRQLSDEEELLNFDTPQGLLLHGEVGCGKSMLMDLFADSLPHVSKQRIHYNNFMLSLYAHIHQISEQRRTSLRSGSKLTLENDFILLQLAERMVDKSTILLLDEFMLPDITAAKIVQTLFTFFFKLGGVLVATSNRLPEELYSTDFRKSQFAKFFQVLQARCVSYDMRSENDWRSILSDPEKASELLVDRKQEKDEFPDIKYYHIPKKGEANEDNEWAHAVQEICQDFTTPRPSHIVVYGHKVNVPWSNKGVAYFDFEDLCGTYLAAADYISLVSRFHTFVIDNVPALKITQKNEARRFITLLDALYEARCRLLIRAEVIPDDLFFADVRDRIDAMEEEGLIGDQITYSAVHQDLSQPFRPNISSYDGNEREQEGISKLTEEERIELERDAIRKEAEERYLKQRNAEKQRIEKEASQKQANIHNNNDEALLSVETPLESPLEPDFSQKYFPTADGTVPKYGPGGAPNFAKTTAFTGEDERFAYKRAVSRLREMTGSPRWVETSRWLPLDEASRPWETFEETSPLPDSYFLGTIATGLNQPKLAPTTGHPQSETIPEWNKKDMSEGYTSPFRKVRNPNGLPKFDARHFWAMVEWGQGKRLKDENAKGWIQSNNDNVKKD